MASDSSARTKSTRQDAGQSADPEPGFFRALFDMRFSGFMAPDMVPLIYRFGVAVAALATIAVIVWAMLWSWIAGLVWLLALGPAMFFALVVTQRVALEFVLAVFRMNAEMHAMESRLGEVVRELREADQLLGRVDYHVEALDRRIAVIQDEFPRLAFWRKNAEKKER